MRGSNDAVRRDEGPMVAQPSSVPIALLGQVDAGTTVWRQRGQLHLTIAVKATFAFVPNGRMSVQRADAIARDERPEASGVGLSTAGDLAPYLGQPEIWLTGHVAVPSPVTHARVSVQLAVMHGGAARMNKQVHLDVASARGNPPMIRVAGMGPVSADWPVRSRWLHGMDRARLSGPVMAIPDTLSWEYFQTAPVDQRLAALQGDEWVVIGGVVPGLPRLSSQLPAASGAARVYRRSPAGHGAEKVVPLRPDMIQIDVDRLRCSVVWRGRLALTSEAEIATLGIAAALEEPGKEVVWKDPFEAERDRPVSVPFSGTAALSAEALRRISEMPATPFETVDPTPTVVLTPKAPSASSFDMLAGTTALDPEALRKVAEQAATPFEPRQEHGSTRPGEPLAGTAALSAEALQKIAEQLATPFDRASDAPGARRVPPGASVSQTMGLSEETLRKIIEQVATPFDAPVAHIPYSFSEMPHSSEIPTPATAKPPDVPAARTAALTAEDLEKIAALSAVPFEKAESPAPALPLATEAQVPLG